ncbi:MAG TPA: signal peptidase I [bacterium]|nr:signal peptidase I [bacterium]HOL67524.1 signal peptidase I [bacterium]HPP11787.1 signal peptidase I [bacterium]
MVSGARKRQKREGVLEWFKSLLWAVAIALLIRAFLVGNFRIPSTSMVPTLKVGDRLLANKVVYRYRRPARGEVVIFKYPEDPSRDFVKRMIALPGERVLIRGGRIYINGKCVEDERVRCRYYYSEGTIGVSSEAQVPPDAYYVLGDNSINSKDSRYWGFVPAKYIVGQAVFTYWPPWRMGFIR